MFSMLTVNGGDLIFGNEILKPEQSEAVYKQTCTQHQRLLSHAPLLDLLLFNWDQTHKRSVKVH